MKSGIVLSERNRPDSSVPGVNPGVSTNPSPWSLGVKFSYSVSSKNCPPGCPLGECLGSALEDGTPCSHELPVW